MAGFVAKVIALEPLFERIQAPVKKYHEVCVFVHHYGGHKRSFKRHIDWLNELGFDCITFNLPMHNIAEIRSKVPINKEWNFGLRHVWADKIENVLGSLCENKFVFSFSSPSASALAVMSKRNAIDIRGWICDGGPFANLSLGIENLIREQGILGHNSSLTQHPFVRSTLAKISAYALGLKNYERDTTSALLSLPKNFPVMSVRGAKDPLVSEEMIDQLFAPAMQNLELHKVSLQNAGHLTGLKDEPDHYKLAVSDFLISRATQIKM